MRQHAEPQGPTKFQHLLPAGDAEADRADGREVVTVVFGLDAVLEPAGAGTCPGYAWNRVPSITVTPRPDG
ncbi:hypothetical protein MesoLj131c_71040 (plasmid) [Mesorhizobium sp. 131-3-5]|nr:hypothetical protein MesoLj131c_71040 [Mesorhizobium sp. 131-3-5]